jgi:hypothetical protein
MLPHLGSKTALEVEAEPAVVVAAAHGGTAAATHSAGQGSTPRHSLHSTEMVKAVRKTHNNV